MLIGATSDLHGYLPDIEPCDILCICGDISPLKIQFKEKDMQVWIDSEFIPWCKTCGAKDVVFIAGNHDSWFYNNRKKDLRSYFKDKGITYLQDTTALINGVSIHGTPWCKEYGYWPFMRSREELIENYSKIPHDIDILLSHDAPMINKYGVILNNPRTDELIDAGNIQLAVAIEEKVPKYALCGHIHSGYHVMQEINGTKLANVSYVGETYQPTYPILYFEI